jgi:excisionase family DNA binding protein
MLFKDSQVATELGVSRRKVWAMLSAGQMPAPVRMGRSVRWRESDIHRWVELGCPSRDEFEAKEGAR